MKRRKDTATKLDGLEESSTEEGSSNPDEACEASNAVLASTTALGGGGSTSGLAGAGGSGGLGSGG